MSLRIKIILPLLLLTTLLVVFLCGYWMPHSLSNIENEHRVLIERHIESVAEAMVPLLLAHQLDTIYENLDALQKRNTDWMSIQLVNADGRTIYPLQISQRASRERSGNDVQTIQRQIDYLGTHLGTLRVRVDFAPKLAVIKKKHWELMTAMLLIIISYVVITLFVLDWTARRPINLLAHASIRLAEGDFFAILPKASDDEVGTLVASFRSMRDAISNYQAERKLAEEALRRLNRELRAISNCNQVLVRAEDEQTLLNDICRIVCGETGYLMAWVGYAENDDARTIRPVARAGVDNGYLEQAGLTWADTQWGRGPSGTAIRSGESVCIQDFTADLHAAPWRDGALQRGYRSSIALPLKDESSYTFGVLNIYSREPDAFNADEIRLLEELSGDLAFGIMVLRTRIENKQAEDTLRHSERLLAEIIDFFPDAILAIDRDKRISIWNRAIEQMTGIPAAEMIGKGDYLYTIPFYGEARPQLMDLFWKSEHETAGRYPILKREGNTLVIEVLCPALYGGKGAWVWAKAAPLRNNEGDLIGAIESIRDIADRKQAEEDLRKLNEELEQRVQDRTAELESKNKELERMNKLFVGRELRMIDLKERIKDLEMKAS